MHHPVGAKKFVEPLVSYLNDRGTYAELWVEPRKELDNFISSITCPTNYARFDLSMNVFKDLARIATLWKRFSKLKPTVIHAHQTRGAFLPLVAACLGNVPIRIYHNHGTPYLGYSGVLRGLLWTLEYLNCKLATHVITVSQSIRGEMINHRIVPLSKCEVLGEGSACGIDLNEFAVTHFCDQARNSSRKRLGISQEAFVAFYVGRPFKRKGFYLLLDMWKKSGLYNGDNVLLIAGCTSVDVKKIIGCQLTGIVALGYKEDLRPYYSACDIVVLPSEHEGFPYSLLEGAAANRALIGTDVPGINSVIKNSESGLLVPVNNIEALTKAFQELRENVGLRKVFGNNGRRIVQQYFDRRTVLRHFGIFMDSVFSRKEV